MERQNNILDSFQQHPMGNFYRAKIQKELWRHCNMIATQKCDEFTLSTLITKVCRLNKKGAAKCHYEENIYTILNTGHFILLELTYFNRIQNVLTTSLSLSFSLIHNIIMDCIIWKTFISCLIKIDKITHFAQFWSGY